MKNLFFLSLFFLAFFSATAQDLGSSFNGDTLTFTQRNDAAFAPLNKSRIPHGILYNRVFQFAHLDEIAMDDTLSVMHWIQGVSELERARYSGSIPDSFLNPRNVRDFLKSENINKMLPVLVLNEQFSIFDSTSVADGRIDTLNGQYYDGTNTGSPYLERQVTFATLGVAQEVETGVVYKMYAVTGYGLSDVKNSVNRLTIKNIATKEQWTLKPDGSQKDFNFTKEGLNLLEFTLDMADGTTRRNYHKLYVSAARTAGTCEDLKPILLDSWPERFQGYYETYPTHTYGEYKTFYSTQSCTHQWQKPIIILDGFDPGDTRGIDDKPKQPGIYNGYLTYKVNGQNISLADELRAIGYDVVILNFTSHNFPIGTKTVITNRIPLQVSTVTVYRDGGADYMERNALLLTKLISKINADMASRGITEKLVVVGPSMGGQISRYALKYMEDNNINHNTRLWVAFDSPNLGANIPYGFQQFLQYSGQNLGNEGALAGYNEQLRSPASQQLTIHQTNPNNMIGFNFPSFSVNYDTYNALNNKNPLRFDWRTKIQSMGYPQNLRRIALANGSLSANEYHFGGDKMFKMEVGTNMFGITLLTAEPYFLACTPNNNHLLNIWKKGSGTVFDRWTHTNLPYKSLDGAQGGYRDFQQSVYAPIDGDNYIGLFSTSVSDWLISPFFASLKTIFGDGTVTMDDRTHNTCFVPTISALAMNDFNGSYDFDWRIGYNDYYLMCNNLTPFHNFYTAPPSTGNQEHITLTEENVAWLLSELDPPKIVGPSSIPPCGQQTYTFDKPISGYVVTWSVTPDLDIVSSTNNSITVAPNQNTTTARITAELGEFRFYFCKPLEISLDITSQSVPINYQIGFRTIPGCYYEAHLTPVIPGDMYAWSFDGTNYVFTPFPSAYPPWGNGFRARVGANDPVWLNIIPACSQQQGSSLYSNFTVQSPSGTDCVYRPNPYGEAPKIEQAEQEGEIKILPNPTTGDWIVYIYKPASQVKARLTNATGQTIWNAETTKNAAGQMVVPGAILPSGVYFLSLTIDGKVSNHRLVKQ